MNILLLFINAVDSGWETHHDHLTYVAYEADYPGDDYDELELQEVFSVFCSMFCAFFTDFSSFFLWLILTFFVTPDNEALLRYRLTIESSIYEVQL